jgi:hypothetical protein
MKTLGDFKKLHRAVVSNVKIFGAETGVMRQYREMGIKFYTALSDDMGISYDSALKLEPDTVLGPKALDELQEITDWYEKTR